MRFGSFKFGSIQIDGKSYEHDVVIEGGAIRKRKKKPSKSLPQLLRTHAAFQRGGHSLGVPAAGGRHWSKWRRAGDGRRQARGPDAPR